MWPEREFPSDRADLCGEIRGGKVDSYTTTTTAMRAATKSAALVRAARGSARAAFSTSARRVAPSPLSITSTEPVFFDRVKLVKTPTVANAPIEEYERIPAFRVLDGEGNVLPGVEGEWLTALQGIPDDKLVKLYKCMLLLPVLVSCCL